MNDIKKIGTFSRFLLWIEKKGNKIPHPITLFLILAVFIILISELLFRLNVSVELIKIDPETLKNVTEQIYVKSMLSGDGIRFMFEKAVTNFTGFAPVGIVIVTIFGIAAADGTGLLESFVKKILLGISEKNLIPVIIFMGIMSNVASDAGYVLVLPLAALIYKSLGKNPLIGIMAGFYGVAGGFSANLLLGSIDPLLGDLSTVGAQTIDPNYYVSPMANYYFMFVSTILLVVVGTIVNNKIVEPKLSKGYVTKNEKSDLSTIGDNERKGLRSALVVTVVYILFILLLIIPGGSILRNQETGSILNKSPFINSIVIIIAVLFFVTGVAYGIGAKTIKSDKDLIKKMLPLINSTSDYLLLTFVAAQFIAYFNYTNLGVISAVSGANLLKSTGVTGIPILVIFILFSAIFNLFIGSAVTKWSIMASIFVPMLMILNISPEVTQLAYRIADSSTNTISPLMPFFGIVLSIVNQHDKEAGMGTVIATMIPYSLISLIAWTLLFVLWVGIGLPIGL